MNRGKRAFFCTAGFGVAFFGATYYLSQPTWQTATEAEVRAVIDPALLVLDPPDLEAQARARRVEALAAQIVGTEMAVSPSPQGLKIFLRTQNSKLKSLRALLAEGPLQNPATETTTAAFPNYATWRPLYSAIGFGAREESAAGRRESALGLIVLGLDASQRLRGAENSIMGTYVGGALDAILHASVRDALPHLGEPELKTLAERLPPAPATDDALIRAIRTEFQAYTLRILPDPLAWAAHQTPNEPATRSLAKLLANKSEGGSEAMGNYDALETARAASHLAATTLRNVQRRRPAWDAGAEATIEGLVRSLPADGSAGTTGIERRLRDFQYRWALKTIPNSTGRRFLGTLMVSAVPDATLGRRTDYEASRTLVALRRYRLRSGKPAAELQDLVRAGLIASLPIDPYGAGNLVYDAKRGRLWSVGQNGSDDGGKGTVFGKPSESDIVWQTP
ncbi:MAG: hypothetical protein ACO1SV_06345 [Fimbriimonas sp.]